MVVACIMLAPSPCVVALDPVAGCRSVRTSHVTWKVREGFSRGCISSTAQSPDGYVWLETEFSLLRFDGVKVVPWPPPAGEHFPATTFADYASPGMGVFGRTTSLPSIPVLADQTISALFEDHKALLLGWRSRRSLVMVG